MLFYHLKRQNRQSCAAYLYISVDTLILYLSNVIHVDLEQSACLRVLSVHENLNMRHSFVGGTFLIRAEL